MFADYDITPNFKRKIPQACNLPASIPVCPQLPNSENRVCFVYFHQASLQWEYPYPCGSFVLKYSYSWGSSTLKYPYWRGSFILEYPYSWGSPKPWTGLMLKQSKANVTDDRDTGFVLVLHFFCLPRGCWSYAICCRFDWAPVYRF